MRIEVSDEKISLKKEIVADLERASFNEKNKV